MSGWTEDELAKIGVAEELDITSYRDDGTIRSYTTIWAVGVGDDLYVRSWRGRSSQWFRRALQRGQGRIRAGGIERDVSFEEPDNIGPRSHRRRLPHQVRRLSRGLRATDGRAGSHRCHLSAHTALRGTSPKKVLGHDLRVQTVNARLKWGPDHPEVGGHVGAGGLARHIYKLQIMRIRYSQWFTSFDR